VPRATTAIAPCTPAAVKSGGAAAERDAAGAVADHLERQRGAVGEGGAVGVDRVDADREVGAREGRGRVVGATLIVLVAVDGLPTMYGAAPELPAEATTMTPSLAALSAATDSGASRCRTASRATC
jgi:hypothetical protein